MWSRLTLLTLVLAAAVLAPPSSGAASAPRLRISANQRYLEYPDGRPFFYLGDTAWELFHRLTREEADLYLANRARKGFTVIQAVVLAELGGVDVPNAQGDLPLVAKDPRRPNEAYFRHVDYIVGKAESLGLFIGMLPTWGSYWKSAGRKDPPLFDAGSAREFGRFLGNRYRDRAIIWILGGDQNVESVQEREVIEAMAAGLREGDGGSHLITYHPRGPGLSSVMFHGASWLDFNMNQSSHGSRDHDNGLFAEHDRALAPAKPTLDGEPRYENIQVGFYFAGSPRYERFDDYDVRQAAYWSLLAGACGHTYGHGSVWQMYAPGRTPVLSAEIPWAEALDHPGAFQMGLVRRLFESRPFTKLRPAQEMIKDGPSFGGAKIRAALAEDGSFAFIYSPRGERFTVDKSMLKARRTREIWFDPRYGNVYLIHTADTLGIQTYTPPASGRGNDWVLVVEDAEANFKLPGQ